MSEMVCLETFSDRQEAELAKAILESEGIRAHVSADDTGGMYVGIAGALGGVRLFVGSDRAADARTILEEQRSDQPAAFPDEADHSDDG